MVSGMAFIMYVSVSVCLSLCLCVCLSVCVFHYLTLYLRAVDTACLAKPLSLVNGLYTTTQYSHYFRPIDRLLQREIDSTQGPGERCKLSSGIEGNAPATNAFLRISRLKIAPAGHVFMQHFMVSADGELNPSNPLLG